MFQPTTSKQTIMDADYTANITLLANTPNPAESLQHCLEQATEGIGLHVNADKMEYICLFKNETSPH